MTRDDIIRMAKEAGIIPLNVECDPSYVPVIERFAALVAAAEREKVAAWMHFNDYTTGHGDTIEDLLKELEWQVAEREREACAKVCDDIDAENDGLDMLATVCAEAIRARGEV